MFRLNRSTAAALLKIMAKEPGRYAMDHAYLATPEPDEKNTPYRAALGHLAHPDASALIVTDGRCLVALPVHLPCDPDEVPNAPPQLDTSGLVSRAVLQAAIGTGSKASRPNAFLDVNGKATVREGWDAHRSQEVPAPNGATVTMSRDTFGDEKGEYPDWSTIVPADPFADGLTDEERSDALDRSVCVNVDYLLRVCKAVVGGGGGVVRITLAPAGTTGPIRVDGLNGPDSEPPPHPGAVGVVMPITVDA